MALQLSKAEIAHLIDSLHTAYRNGYRTETAFLNFLDGQSVSFLIAAHKNESKARDTQKSERVCEAFRRIARNCRKAARFSKRLHTKILKHRAANTQ